MSAWRKIYIIRGMYSIKKQRNTVLEKEKEKNVYLMPPRAAREDAEPEESFRINRRPGRLIGLQIEWHWLESTWGDVYTIMYWENLQHVRADKVAHPHSVKKRLAISICKVLRYLTVHHRDIRLFDIFKLIVHCKHFPRLCLSFPLFHFPSVFVSCVFLL